MIAFIHGTGEKARFRADIAPGRLDYAWQTARNDIPNLLRKNRAAIILANFPATPRNPVSLTHDALWAHPPPNKQVLHNISLGLYYGAKIGVRLGKQLESKKRLANESLLTTKDTKSTKLNWECPSRSLPSIPFFGIWETRTRSVAEW